MGEFTNNPVRRYVVTTKEGATFTFPEGCKIWNGEGMFFVGRDRMYFPTFALPIQDVAHVIDLNDMPEMIGGE